ncbi:MAG: RIP metalloprotease RseP, partial [Pseudomonadota bacterium]|nr:RIP metalloprotease RseP [Pseudomonadota bacterium]
MEILQYPLAFLLLLGVIVVFHEFGHFVVARRSGVHVVRFSVGFGKPLLRWSDKYGTEFALAAIPFGGYVQMYDDRDPVINAVDNNSIPEGAIGYTGLSPLWRIAISLAGPAANFLLAISIYTLLFMVGTLQFTPTFDGAKADTALANAGGDRPFEVLSVDGEPVQNYQDVAMGLGDRLGESGEILLSVVDLESSQRGEIKLPIERWHEGVGEPDLFGSLNLRPVRLSIVGQVVEGSAAQRAGLQTGDWIVAVDGERVSRWSDWVDHIVDSPGRAMVFEVLREGRRIYLTAVADSVTTQSGVEIGRLGVAPVK